MDSCGLDKISQELSRIFSRFHLTYHTEEEKQEPYFNSEHRLYSSTVVKFLILKEFHNSPTVLSFLFINHLKIRSLFLINFPDG